MFACLWKQNVYSTMYSQAVTHPSTNMAQCCLTSVIRRELVFSTWYGRRQMRVTHLTWSFTFWGLKLLVPFIWIVVQVSIVLVVYRTKQLKLDSLLKEVCIHYNSPRTVISSGSMKDSPELGQSCAQIERMSSWKLCFLMLVLLFVIFMLTFKLRSIADIHKGWTSMLRCTRWSALRSGDTVTNDRIERCCYC